MAKDFIILGIAGRGGKTSKNVTRYLHFFYYCSTNSLFNEKKTKKKTVKIMNKLSWKPVIMTIIEPLLFDGPTSKKITVILNFFQYKK